MLDNALLEVGMAVPGSEHLEAMCYYGTLRPLRPKLYSQSLEGMTSRRNLAFGFRDIPLNGPALHAHHMVFSVFDNVYNTSSDGQHELLHRLLVYQIPDAIPICPQARDITIFIVI